MSVQDALNVIRLRRSIGGGTSLLNPLPAVPTPSPTAKLPEPSPLPGFPDTPVLLNPPAPIDVSNNASVKALQRGMDVIVTNISNANTPAFKRRRVVFGETASGVRVAAVHRNWSQGALRATGRPLDCAIKGAGFFVVESAGRTYYTRLGAFHKSQDGTLELRLNGRRYRTVRNVESGVLTRVEDLHIAAIANPETLEVTADGLFTATAKTSIQRGEGRIMWGCLEGANVDLEAETSQLKRLAAQMKALKAALALLPDTAPRPIVTRPIPKRSAARDRSLEASDWTPWR